jgi:3-oxoadipate enol-lactonase
VAGEGPPVVLLHAALGGRTLWDAQWDAFAERHRVVRYDSRGFGDSPLPGGPFSYVEDVCALFEHLGIEHASLVGNSLGGMIALELALAEPERVEALVLVDSALRGAERSPELEAFGAEEDALLDAGKLDEAVELNLRTWMSPDVERETRARVGELQRQTFEVLLAAYEREPEPGPVSWPSPKPAAERLAEIRHPTLVVVGEEDVPDFHAIADRLTTEIPRARKTVVPGAHLPGVERPDEFNRIVLEFLADPVG